MNAYYVLVGGAQYGPYTVPQLRSFWDSGSIAKDALYWTEGMTEWAPIAQLMQSPDLSTFQPLTNVALDTAEQAASESVEPAADTREMDPADNLQTKHVKPESSTAVSMEATTPEAKYSMSHKDREVLQANIRKFQTIMFFEPFTYTICGPKHKKWQGHALGLVLGTGLMLSVAIFLIRFVHGPHPGIFQQAAAILAMASVFTFVVARVFAVIAMGRILKIFGDNGIKEFGALQAIYKVHSFFGKAAGINLIIPGLMGVIIEGLSTLVLCPFAFLLILPVVGSIWMHNAHKKLLNLLSMVEVKEAS